MEKEAFFFHRNNKGSCNMFNSNIKEFKVNKRILLRLEGKNTVIYVDDKRINICKRLFIVIPEKSTKTYDEIDSIDEASELYNQYLIDNKIYKEENGKLLASSYTYDIPPEAEFWGHCSNIQAWVEYNYDTRLLHSHLSFPLLKELMKAGDPIAKRVFKEEIATRFLKGYISVKEYLVKEKFLNFLNTEELICICEEYLKLLEVLNYNEDTAKEARFMIYFALKHLDKTSCKKILGIYKNFLKNKKSMKEICDELGSSYIKDKKNEEAIKLYKIELDYNFNDIDAWIELGILYRLKRKFKKSIQALYEALKIEKINSYALIQLGTTFTAMKKYEDSIETFKQARKIDPHNFLALGRLGIIFEKMGKYKKAIRILKKAHKINETDTEIFEILGGIYYSLKKYSKSIKAYRSAISHNSEDDWLWYRLGSNYCKRNQIDKAINAYMEAYRINSRGFSTLHKLIKAFYKNGDFKWAKGFCKQMLFFFPDSPIAVETLNKIACNESKEVDPRSKDCKTIRILNHKKLE